MFVAECWSQTHKMHIFCGKIKHWGLINFQTEYVGNTILLGNNQTKYEPDRFYSLKLINRFIDFIIVF